jgi:glutamyl-tRNA synthetase
MILGSDKTRLSKRHGATSIMAYKEMGYLPDAVVNYLVRLGWSYGDQEIFTREELIEKFSFDRAQTSAAVFNPEKMLWINAQYIQYGSPADIVRELRPLLDQAGFGEEAGRANQKWLEELVVLVRERTKTLVEMVQWVTPYFGEEPLMEEAAVKKFLTASIAPLLAELIRRYESFGTFAKEPWESEFKRLVEEQGIKMGQLAQPVRVALTGRTASPGLFEVMEVLGRERTLYRLRRGLDRAKLN